MNWFLQTLNHLLQKRTHRRPQKRPLCRPAFEALEDRCLLSGVPTLESGWTKPVVGDFDGNGSDDIASFRTSDGTWWVTRSTGAGFETRQWADFGTDRGWTSQLVGDFDGDGRDDIADFHPSNGNWWVARSTGTGFDTRLWADFGTDSGWTNQLVGDFNGDGLDDIANFHPSNGNWWVARSTGTAFDTQLWADFGTNSGWTSQVVGDFDGDRKDDIANFHPTDGTWWVARSLGGSFDTQLWANFGTDNGWTAQLTGNYDGKGGDDIANFHPSDGNWWVAQSSGAGFGTTLWKDTYVFNGFTLSGAMARTWLNLDGEASIGRPLYAERVSAEGHRSQFFATGMVYRLAGGASGFMHYDRLDESILGSLGQEGLYQFGNSLLVIGTGNRDTGQIWVEDQSGELRWTITIGDKVFQRLATDIVPQKIIFYGLGGDDTFENNTGIRSDLHGGDGIDTLIGGTGNDVIDGGSGHDVLTGGLGYDVIAGGADTDRLVETADNTEYQGRLILKDSVLYGLGGDSLSGIEQAELFGNDYDNELNASGFSGSVIIRGGLGNDTLTGGKGIDFLYGDSGDQLVAGPGDLLTFQLGNQVFTVSDGTIHRFDGVRWTSLNNNDSVTFNGHTFRGIFLRKWLELGGLGVPEGSEVVRGGTGTGVERFSWVSFAKGGIFESKGAVSVLTGSAWQSWLALPGGVKTGLGMPTGGYESFNTDGQAWDVTYFTGGGLCISQDGARIIGNQNNAFEIWSRLSRTEKEALGPLTGYFSSGGETELTFRHGSITVTWGGSVVVIDN